MKDRALEVDPNDPYDKASYMHQHDNANFVTYLVLKNGLALEDAYAVPDPVFPISGDELALAYPKKEPTITRRRVAMDHERFDLKEPARYPAKNVWAEFHTYMDPRAGVAIRFMTDADGYEEVQAAVSVNLGQMNQYPSDGCIFVKDYEENEGMLNALTELGFLETTGRIEYGGWNGELPFYEARVSGPWAEKFIVAEAEGNAQRARVVADSGEKDL